MTVATKGRQRVRLQYLLQPKSAESILQTTEAIERWEGDMREYEQRFGKTLDEDVKISVLLALAPAPMQNHCHLNTHRHILKSCAQVTTMLFDYCRAQPAGDVAPMDLSMLGKGKGRKGKGKGKGKGKSQNDQALSWILSCLESGKDTASLETPITPVAKATTEPPIAGMLKQSDEAEVVPAQWLYSVTTREPSREEFLIHSGAATSVFQQSLADSLGGPGRTRCGPQVGHWTSVHDDWHHDDLLAHTRWYQRCGRLSDCTQGHWTAEIYHIGWTSVRQRQHHHVPQHRWNDTQRAH